MNTVAAINQQYNYYPEIIVFDITNPVLRSPHATTDLYFYQTRETLRDIDLFRNFLKNAEKQFRQSDYYKAYKSYLIEYIGINRCQVFGNITTEDADIELHHNVIGLFDMAMMITLHTVNTIGCISTFDLVQLLINEHYNNRVGVTFLSKTAHQKFTNDPEAYIPPSMTFGAWWELLTRYSYGITFEIANKVLKYIKKYQDNIPISIDLQQQEQILSFAYYNEYGMPKEMCGNIPSEEYYDLGGGDFDDYEF